jgi:hypothetical protein
MPLKPEISREPTNRGQGHPNYNSSIVRGGRHQPLRNGRKSVKPANEGSKSPFVNRPTGCVACLSSFSPREQIGPTRFTGHLLTGSDAPRRVPRRGDQIDQPSRLRADRRRDPVPRSGTGRNGPVVSWPGPAGSPTRVAQLRNLVSRSAPTGWSPTVRPARQPVTTRRHHSTGPTVFGTDHCREPRQTGTSRCLPPTVGR